MNTQSIIDRYADKTKVPDMSDEYPYQQKITGSGLGIMKEINKPVLISDIIFKLQQAQVMKLVRLWRPFENKSLQEIAEMKCWHDEEKYGACSCENGTPKEAQDLFDFLDNINNGNSITN